jgi:hypothetical protein
MILIRIIDSAVEYFIQIKQSYKIIQKNGIKNS